MVAGLAVRVVMIVLMVMIVVMVMAMIVMMMIVVARKAALPQTDDLSPQ
jgi:hypothetical protein